MQENYRLLEIFTSMNINWYWPKVCCVSSNICLWWCHCCWNKYRAYTIRYSSLNVIACTGCQALKLNADKTSRLYYIDWRSWYALAWTYSFLMVAASSPLSTMGVFWVVCWIDILGSVLLFFKKTSFLKSLVCLGVSPSKIQL